MANKRFLITIIEFDESCLTKDLPFPEVPHAVGASVDDLPGHGAFNTQKVYLLEREQRDHVQRILEQHPLQYPELIRDMEHAAKPLAAVVSIHDRRRHPENPGDNPRAS